MANRIELGRGQFVFENKFVIEGKEEVVKFIDTLNSMTRKNNFAAYWKSQEELVRSVTKACEDFNKTQSKADAKNLINNFNALKAVSEKSLDSLFADSEKIISSFEEAARRMGNSVVGELSPENFRKAFESFEMLQALGMETGEIFKRISSTADANKLREQVDELTDALARANRLLRKTIEERDSLLNWAEINRLREVEAQFDYIKDQMKNEFAAFLSANDLDSDSSPWGRFSELFAQIADGSMTAKEAITQVRDQYAALIQDGQAGDTVFSSGQMQEFIDKLENACTMIEQMRGELQALTEGAALREVSNQLAESEAITDRQKEAIASLVSEGSGLGSVAQLLVELIKNFDATEHETTQATEAVKGLLETLKSIADVGEGGLKNVSRVFENLGHATALNVDAKQFQNLTGALKDIGDIPQLGSLQALTNISLAGFNDLHISKASLSNLATYLPEIARADIDRLKGLSSVDLSGFNNLSVRKATTDNLERLFNALSGKQTAASAAETAAVAEEKETLGDVNKLYEAHKTAVEAAVKAEKEKARTAGQLGTALDEEGKGADKSTAKLKAHEKAITEVWRKLTSAQAARAKLEKTNPDAASELDAYDKQIRALEELIEKDKGREMSSRELRNELTSITLEYEKARNAAEENIETTRREADTYKDAADAASRAAEAQRNVKDLTEAVGRLHDEAKREELNVLIKELDDLRVAAIDTGKSADEKSRAWDQYKEKLKEVRHAVSEEVTAERTLDQERRKNSSTYEQINRALQKTADLELKYAHASSQERDAIRNVSAELRTLKTGFEGGNVKQEEAVKTLERLKRTLSDVETRLKTSGNALQRWWNNGLTQLSSRFSYTFGMAAIVTKSIAEVRKMISTAVELDTAMNNLQIVTRGSNDDMAAYGKTVSQMAKETAQSTKDLIDATTVYARLGYTMDESATLAKFTAMLQGVGDIEASAAQDAMTAVLKAFDIKVDEVESVMDKFVTVGNNFPISVAQIAEGMNNAGSMLETSGNSLEQSIALLTSANTTVNMCRAA